MLLNRIWWLPSAHPLADTLTSDSIRADMHYKVNDIYGVLAPTHALPDVPAPVTLAASLCIAGEGLATELLRLPRAPTELLLLSRLTCPSAPSVIPIS